MSLINLVIFLAIGLLAGWVASQLIKGRSLGILWNLIIGVIGSYLGYFLAGVLGLGSGNLIGQVAIAIGGSLLLLIIIGFIKKKL
jgi:uncharacterized membrane protein YeaQ/YmgE (transglycosylase-associated protein family)